MVFVTKDIRHLFLAIRDQGSRPTCLAFAASDAHAAMRPPHNRLSVEYLFLGAATRMGSTDLHYGLELSAVTQALHHDGQPLELAYPYGHSGAITKAAQLFKSESVHRLQEDICCLIDNDIPPVVIFQLSRAFFLIDKTGIMSESSSDCDIPNLHAIIVVAYGHFARRKYFLVRNSWGNQWADNGYAWLSEEYLAKRARSITSIGPIL